MKDSKTKSKEKENKYMPLDQDDNHNPYTNKESNKYEKLKSNLYKSRIIGIFYIINYRLRNYIKLNTSNNILLQFLFCYYEFLH